VDFISILPVASKKPVASQVEFTIYLLFPRGLRIAGGCVPAEIRLGLQGTADLTEPKSHFSEHFLCGEIHLFMQEAVE
jgi:hypothetical protein